MVWNRPVYSGNVEPVDPQRYAHCPQPGTPDACGDKEMDVGDNAVTWVVVREYIRANDPSKLAACDAAFREGYTNCMDGDQWRKKYAWIMQMAEAFAQEMEGYMIFAGIFGADAEQCTIDWRVLGCTSYWLAHMTKQERANTVGAMTQGMAAVPVCPPVVSDPVYGNGPMSMSTVPIPPAPKAAKKGMTTGEKVAIAAGVATVAVVAGLAGLG
jgi:hypothetical protein